MAVANPIVSPPWVSLLIYVYISVLLCVYLISCSAATATYAIYVLQMDPADRMIILMVAKKQDICVQSFQRYLIMGSFYCE